MSELALQLIAENKERHAWGEHARTLDLGDCGLREVPEEIGELIWLETVLLGFSSKSSLILTTALLGLKNIKSLTITVDIPFSAKQIKNVEIIGQLYSLEFLKLTSVYINNLSFLKSLVNLKKLTVEDYGYDDISPISNLTNLEYLQLSNISYILSDYCAPTDFGKTLEISDISCLTSLTSLKDLHFGGTNISDISLVEHLPKLENISLGETNINDFSCLQKTRIKSFGAQLMVPSAVETFGVLDTLKYLNLSFSQLENINFLRNITNLEAIDLTGNPIIDISPIKDLKYLTQINLSATKIHDITPLLEKIRQGIKVYDHDPNVSGEDEYIEDAFSNPYIILGECPNLINPDTSVIRRGNTAIINYFSERSKQQFKNTEIKLILLGNSTAGKTTLSRYLREQTYEPNQCTTHGIQNHRWQSPGGRDMDVNIWDFGGQEYYHATHRLFLSRNSVYALLWDAKTDKGGIEPTEIHYDNDRQAYQVPLEHFPKAWWLKNIHFNLNKYARHEREGDASIPVLLVQNKCAAGEDYDVQDVPNEFGDAPFYLPAKWRNQHIDIAAAANEQANGEQAEWTMRFKLFENELLKTLESQMATYEFAVYHRDIRDRVRLMASGENPVNEMSWTDFEAMCRDIEPEAKMDLVQIYLRDITGDILHFDQNERLGYRVFLRPDWVCNRIYAILSRKVLDREGLFDLDWVSEALQCDEGEALDFVELMRMFELVFPDKDEAGKSNGRYVAPQYLPEFCRKNEYLQGLKEDKILTHAFTIWFPNFFPKSHFARFISNWGAQAEGRIFWKNGLLFKTENLKALVERSEEFKIRVDIQTGNQLKREAAMRRILQSFLDLEDGKGYWESPDGTPWMLEDGGFWEIGEKVEFAVSLDGNNYAFWDDIYQAFYQNASHVKAADNNNSKLINIQLFKTLIKPGSMTKKVFISYSHKDEEAMKELDKFLGPLERKGEISIWTDRNILPGQNWKAEILNELESADLTLLLVSANFLDSNFIHDEEIPRAFKRREEAGKHVVPIILNYCLWDITDLGSLQAIPKDGRPIADFPNPAQAWSEVARGIMALLK